MTVRDALAWLLKQDLEANVRAKVLVSSGFPNDEDETAIGDLVELRLDRKRGTKQGDW